MPAYNFKDRFADLVELGRKPHTIRVRRARPTRIGDTLYLYSGMRHPNCRLLRVEQCIDVTPIKILSGGIVLETRLLCLKDSQAIAIADGFSDYASMVIFFDDTYGNTADRNNLEMIQWRPSTVRKLQKEYDRVCVQFALEFPNASKP